MALLRMLNRSAFICNVCFLLAIWILWLKHPVNEGLVSLIIVMGFFLSVLLNTIVILWLLVLRVKKKTAAGIPEKLIYLNGGFLLVQIFLLIKSYL
jgi:hypothetical protein